MSDLNDEEVPAGGASDDEAISDGEETASTPQAEPAGIEAELEAARVEAAENRDRWLRASADLENFRRRAARELEEARSRARAEVLLDMVALLDDVDRALAAVGEAPGNKPAGKSAGEGGGESAEEGIENPIVAGIRLIRARLTEILRRHGVVEIEAEGQAFDPHLHEAVLQVPAGEVPDGRVAQVLQRGYWLGERVLRPAKVAVAGVRQRAQTQT